MSAKNVQNFRGTRDWIGEEMRWRQGIISTIQRVFESFGFEPLETPVIESMATLTGKYGEEGETKLFRLAGGGMTNVSRGGLRYDHTVPLARAVAQHWQDVILPYRRYVIGPVFRDEATQAGRFRQFWQADFDTVGSTSLLVDAEVPAMNVAVFQALGFPAGSFTVAINDRRLLNAMASAIGANPTEAIEIFRAWDKLEKASRTDVRDELTAKRVRQEVILRFDLLTDLLLVIKDDPADQILWKITDQLQSPEVNRAASIIDLLFGYIAAMGVPSWAYRFNPLLARGLDYYTGPIFETVAGGLGSITGGGRFDELIAKLGGPDMPASGSSFGLERVMGVMEDLGLKPEMVEGADVYITVFDQGNSDLVQASFRAASALRLTGYRVEVYTGDQAKLGKQLDISQRKFVPVCVIIGPDEAKSGSVMVKDMTAERGTQNQFLVPEVNLVSMVEKLLNGN